MFEVVIIKKEKSLKVGIKNRSVLKKYNDFRNCSAVNIIKNYCFYIYTYIYIYTHISTYIHI